MPRKWANEEVEMLMEFVEKNRSCLTNALKASKTKKCYIKKWAEITSSANSNGDDPFLEVEQVKQKML